MYPNASIGDMEKVEDLQLKEVIIAGRKYPVKVSKTELEALAKIEQEVNDELYNIQMRYADRDKQDCLSMTLLSYAMRLKKLQQDQQSANLAISNIESMLALSEE